MNPYHRTILRMHTSMMLRISRIPGVLAWHHQDSSLGIKVLVGTSPGHEMVRIRELLVSEHVFVPIVAISAW